MEHARKQERDNNITCRQAIRDEGIVSDRRQINGEEVIIHKKLRLVVTRVWADPPDR